MNSLFVEILMNFNLISNLNPEEQFAMLLIQVVVLELWNSIYCPVLFNTKTLSPPSCTISGCP